MTIAALARPEAAGWTLDFFGDGHQFSGLQRLAERLGVAGRVTFMGQRPREEVMAAMSTADALLFPSMHDQAPWAVAEALSVGCPVICLDRGGPAVLVGQLEGVKVQVTQRVVEDLANALGSLGGRFAPVTRWSEERLSGLLVEWYREVGGRESRPSPTGTRESSSA